MTQGRSAPAVNRAVAERWQALLGSSGPLSRARRLDGHDRGPSEPGEASARQIDIREMFIGSAPGHRGRLDVLCVALAERRPCRADQPATHELTVFGPGVLRMHTSSGASGRTVTDLRLGPEGTGLRSVSLIVFRAERGLRVRDMIASIEDLGRILDYRNDPTGSGAVAATIVGRLELLSATQGVTVSVAGTAGFEAEPTGGESYQLLVGRDAPLMLRGDLAVRRGRVRAVDADGRSVDWREADFALLRTGGVTALRGDARSIDQLRREHALNENALDAEDVPDEESWSAQAARARQSSRAGQIVRYAVQGEAAAARSEYRAALTQPGADGPLVDSLVGQVTTMQHYWLVDDVLRDGADTGGASTPLRAAAVAVRKRFGTHLDQLLGLAPQPPGQNSEPPNQRTESIVLEVGDALVPIVDSSQDGGTFLHELIPTMRGRIRAGMGITVPGVRMRDNPALPPGGYEIQVDEVPVRAGSVLLGTPYAVRTPEPGMPDTGAEPTGVHPLTGERGLWLLAPAEEALDAGAERLTTAQYLIHHLELGLRAHLVRFLGPQEVDILVDTWAQQGDGALVASTLPDTLSRLRLTWVLQALVDDQVPITDWQSILRAVRDAGGTSAPVHTLRRAARARLRDRLPGPRSGDRVVRVPAEYQAMLVPHPRRPGDVLPGVGRLNFLRWVQETVAHSGSAVALVTDTEEIRELVAVLTRSDHPFVTTFSEEEVSAS